MESLKSERSLLNTVLLTLIFQPKMFLIGSVNNDDSIELYVVQYRDWHFLVNTFGQLTTFDGVSFMPYLSHGW